jgi:transcription factor CP2-like protein
VFKSKGADRKHKTDRDRIAKQPDSSLYFQPSYDCTLLTTYNEDETLSRSISSNVIKDSPSPKITSSRSHSASDSSPSSVILNVATSSTSNSCHSPQSTIVSTISLKLNIHLNILLFQIFSHSMIC